MHLDGGTVVPYDGGEYRIHRGMLAVEFAVPAGAVGQSSSSASAGGGSRGALNLTVACTHLDHITEAERETQLRHIVRSLGGDERAVVLLGDLNALTRSDYSADEWAVLEGENAANGWHPPSAGCLGILEESGWRDCFARLHAPTRSSPPSPPYPEWQRRWTAHTEQPRFRIDYSWLSAGARAAGLRPVGAFVLTGATQSDHFPLVVDLAIDAAGECEGERGTPAGAAGGGGRGARRL